MAALDTQLDKSRTPDIARQRKRIAELASAEATLAASKKRDNKKMRADLRRDAEASRNALADIAIEYAAQLETAEALVRLEHAQNIAAAYRKHFPDSVWRLDQRSKAGDARASATLGALNRLGIVAEQNADKSCSYYLQAAQKAHVAALYRASDCGDARADSNARFREAAAQGGHAVAQEMKGRACLREKRDYDCALTWLDKAAAQGRPSAQSLLGWLYLTGEGVPRDETRGFGYVLSAAKLGDAAAQNNLGQLYETGRGVKANATEAFAWYKKAAEAGLGHAQINVARCYIEGRGTPVDKTAASAWLQKAQQQGVPEAQKLLDWLSRQG